MLAGYCKVSLHLRIKFPFTALQILNFFWRNTEQRGRGGDDRDPAIQSAPRLMLRFHTWTVRNRTKVTCPVYPTLITCDEMLSPCSQHKARGLQARQKLQAGRHESQMLPGRTSPRTQERQARCSPALHLGLFT